MMLRLALLLVASTLTGVSASDDANGQNSTLLADNAKWKACVASGGLKCDDDGACGDDNCLQLNEKGLTGTIPPADLAKMTGLGGLDLDGNFLKGPIPDTIGLLTNLRGLDLSSNGLEGIIPDSIGLLTNLHAQLRLQNNRFTGAGTGLCTVSKNFEGWEPCYFAPNMKWTNETLCPKCLNYRLLPNCAAPIVCTGN